MILKTYKKIVSEENEILKELASQNDLTLIDTASLIEKVMKILLTQFILLQKVCGY